MKKLLNNPFAVGGLVLAAVTAGFWPQIESKFASSKPRPRLIASGAPGAPGAPDQSAGAGDAGTLNQRIRQAFETNSFAPVTRNPFVFVDKQVSAPAPVVAAPAQETQSVRLGAIWMQEGVSLALLDHRIAVAGDKIGFIEVGEITSDGVWLVHQGDRVFLQLGEQHSFEQSTEPSVHAPP